MPMALTPFSTIRFQTEQSCATMASASPHRQVSSPTAVYDNLNCGDNTNSYGFNEIKYSTFSSGTTVCAYGVSFTAPSGYAPTAVYNAPDNLACGFYNTVYSYNSIQYTTFSAGLLVCAYGVSFTPPAGYVVTEQYAYNVPCGDINNVEGYDAVQYVQAVGTFTACVGSNIPAG